MRRNLIKEEGTETPVRFSAPPQVQEQLPATQALAAPGVGSVTQPERKRATRPGGGRALRAGILLFSSLGLFTLLVPTMTGVPLTEWLQGANFKATYSGSNLNYMRGSAALKLGNLGGATDALVAMPPRSTEASDLGVVLFPRLVSSEDYTNALRVCLHLLPRSVQKHTIALTNTVSSPDYQTNISGTVNLREIGKHMAMNLGPEKALALISSTPELNAERELLIPALFAGVAGQTEMVTDPKTGGLMSVPVRAVMQKLETLIPTLSGQSQTEAIGALSKMHVSTREVTLAWEWSAKLPPAERLALRLSMAGDLLLYSNELVDLFVAMPAGVEADTLRARAIGNVAAMRPNYVNRLLASIKTPAQRNLALQTLAQSTSTKIKIPLLEQITDPAIKVQTMASIAGHINQPEAIREVLPYFTEFTRQNPQFVEQHDNALHELAARSTVPAEQENYLNRMLNPAAKAKALETWKTSRLTPIVPGGGVGGVSYAPAIQ